MNWVILAVLSALFAGLVPIFGKVGLKSVDTTVVTAARCIVMTFMLVGVVFAQAKFGDVLKLSWKEWTPVILSGLCGAASWLCYFEALKLGTASKVSSIDKMSLVVTICLAALFLGEAITWKVAIGAVLICVGVLTIIQQ